MAIMCGVVGALSAFYHDSTDISDPRQREIASYRLVAKMPTIAAWAYKYSLGQPFIYPRNDLTYAEDFLHMMFATPCEEYKVSPIIAKAMDRILTLHADHEQNASTSTVRLAGSSGANPFACIAAGIASLWGPAHGGANEAVLSMLHEIGSVDNIDEYVKKAKDKDDPFRLMGFGHRVYKNFDPRATLMRETCHEVLGELGMEDEPLLKLAMELERIALEDEYFVERKLYPKRRFLFRYHFPGHRHPGIDVHGALCCCPHRRLGITVERDDRGPFTENRPAASALYRRNTARFCGARQTLNQVRDQSKSPAEMRGFFY